MQPQQPERRQRGPDWWKLSPVSHATARELCNCFRILAEQALGCWAIFAPDAHLTRHCNADCMGAHHVHCAFLAQGTGGASHAAHHIFLCVEVGWTAWIAWMV